MHEIKITIGEKEHPIKATIEAMISFEEKSGKKYFDVLEKPDALIGDLPLFLTFIWAHLKAGNKDFGNTPRELAAEIKGKDLIPIMQNILAAVRESFPEQKKEEVKDSVPLAQPQTGTTSGQ